MTRQAVVKRARIAGTGLFVPPGIVTNRDLEELMDTSDEWIQQRTGIKERRYAEPGIGVSDLAVDAAKAAITSAGKSIADVDLVIFATLSPDYYFPGSGVMLADKLGMGTTPALDIRNQCSGFLYGLDIASLYVSSGRAKNVLLVGSETHSRGLNFTTEGRDVAVIFGDGAGAVLVSESPDDRRGVLAVRLHADGAHRDQLKIEFPSMRQKPFITPENISSGAIWPKMDGRYVFKHAVTRMPEVVGSVMADVGVTPNEVDLYVFHQANLRINEAVMKHLGQPMDKSFNNIERYGNCSAASIPMCLDEARRAGRLKDGDLVCMASFGAGFTWGAALVRW